MKKILGIILCFALMFSAVCIQSQEISVALNGEKINFDQPPIIMGNRVLVPIRAVCENLGAYVYWNEKVNGVFVVKNNIKLLIPIEYSEFFRIEAENYEEFMKRFVKENIENDSFFKKIVLDVPVQIIGDRALMPVRAICESLGTTVEWIADSKTVSISCSEDFVNDKNKDKDFYEKLMEDFKKMDSEEMYKDRIEYPLEKVDVMDSSEYMLVKTTHSGKMKSEIITDTALIKENKDIFKVDNKSEIYATTAEGTFALYKDGELLGITLFDPQLTRSIDYGTLDFKAINELQLMLLHGAEIIEEEENYTIVRTSKDDPYYYLYAHGDDKLDPNKVFLVDSNSKKENLLSTVEKHGNIIEFIATVDAYTTFTRHVFFDLDKFELSDCFRDVKAVKGTMIVYPKWENDGENVIVVCDMFEYDKRIELSGEFSETTEEKFLISAEFREDSKLWAKYILPDGSIGENVFDLK